MLSSREAKDGGLGRNAVRYSFNLILKLCFYSFYKMYVCKLFPIFETS